MDRLFDGKLSRRELLKIAAGGAVSLAFAPASYALPLFGKSGKAKAVIQIWMWGGPSHLDTFDPKPEAGYDYCGPFKSPIETNVKGIRICEMLPLMAKQADKYAILRAVTHRVNGHETATYIVQTGHQPDRIEYPSVGSVVSLFKGYDHGYKGIVPPYIALTDALGRFSECGFLGPRYKPFATGGDPNQSRFTVEGIISASVADQRQQDRRALLHNLDTLGRAMPDNPQFVKLDQAETGAYDMILGEARKLFDLGQEPAKLRDAYGRHKFGQSCLMARRLVEIGVPFVAINYGGWDTHKQHFEAMRRQLPQLDQGFSTLLADLSDRGLLDSTIVWWTGEFGRTPKVQWEAPWNGGRNHYGNCFNAVVAGGGFKGGCVVGRSDARGEEPYDRPVRPQDLIGSIYELLGIDPDGPMPNPRGMDIKVMPADADGNVGYGRLKEIM